MAGIGCESQEVTHCDLIFRKMMLRGSSERRGNHHSAGTTRRYLRFSSSGSPNTSTKSPDKLGPDDLRSYQAYLLRELKLCPGSVENHVAAPCGSSSCARFVAMSSASSCLYPKSPRKLPNILSLEEVARLINASSSLFQRTLLLVLYGTGMRRAELAPGSRSPTSTASA